MSRSRICSLVSSILLFWSIFGSALQVAPDSPCALECLDNPDKGNVSYSTDSNTYTKDLQCYDELYEGTNQTAAGAKFKECQDCLKGSGYSDTTSNETDSSWFLFNNRAVVDWCISGNFGNKTNANVTDSNQYKLCHDDCASITSAANQTMKSNETSYDFCDTPGNFTSNAKSCIECFYRTEQSIILGNILTTVVEQCEQKPNETINFPEDQEIYAATRITLSATSASPSNSSAASSSAPPVSSPEPSSGLSTGVLAGIVLGGLVGLALILTGILLLLRRKKNQTKAMEIPGAQYGESHGMMATKYQYNSMPESNQERYAYQPAEGQAGPMKAGAQVIHSTPSDSAARH